MQRLSVYKTSFIILCIMLMFGCHKKKEASTVDANHSENTGTAKVKANHSDHSAIPAKPQPQPATAAPSTSLSDSSETCLEKSTFCASKMDFSTFPKTFVVSSPAVTATNVMPKKFGCNRYGGLEVSPPIAWQGLPVGTTNLELKVIDATCAYGCAGPLGGCCQFQHWVLDIPLAKTATYPSIFSGQAIKAGVSNNRAMGIFSKPNGIGKRTYFPFCPPSFQTHAFYIQAVAYQTDATGKKVVTGKSQSAPWLLWAPDIAAAKQQVAAPKAAPKSAK